MGFHLYRPPWKNARFLLISENPSWKHGRNPQDLSSGPHPAVAYPHRARFRHSPHEVFHGFSLGICGTPRKYPKVVTCCNHPMRFGNTPKKTYSERPCGPRVVVDTQRLPGRSLCPLCSKWWSIELLRYATVTYDVWDITCIPPFE